MSLRYISHAHNRVFFNFQPCIENFKPIADVGNKSKIVPYSLPCTHTQIETGKPRGGSQTFSTRKTICSQFLLPLNCFCGNTSGAVVLGQNMNYPARRKWCCCSVCEDVRQRGICEHTEPGHPCASPGTQNSSHGCLCTAQKCTF